MAGSSASSTSRRNPCGVCASARSSRGMVPSIQRCSPSRGDVLDGVVDARRGDGGATARRGVDDAADDGVGDERTCRVVHEHDVGVAGDGAPGPRQPSPAGARRPARLRSACHPPPRQPARAPARGRRPAPRRPRHGCAATPAHAATAVLEDGAVAQQQPLLGDGAAEPTALPTRGDHDVDDHETLSMRVVRYTAMRSAARSILAVMLTTVLLGAALHTLRGLRQVDPRGRASWSTTTPAFDATPRDVTLFLPACDVQAIVLHPAPASDGHVDADVLRRPRPMARAEARRRRQPLRRRDCPSTLPLGDRTAALARALTGRAPDDHAGRPACASTHYVPVSLTLAPTVDAARADSAAPSTGLPAPGTS